MKNLRLIYHIVAITVYAVVASGCANDEGDARDSWYHDAPVARANAPETTAVGTIVPLDGSKSYDENDLALRYHWALVEVPAGSNATLNNRNLQNPSFLADVMGDFVVALSVDNGIWESETVEVTIKVLDCRPQIDAISANLAEPVPDAVVQVGATVSEECDEQQPYQYKWAFGSLPAGSRAVLNDPGVIAPSFLVDTLGEYVVTLVVTDALGRRSKQAFLTITAIE
jgi:hypothetical protein